MHQLDAYIRWSELEQCPAIHFFVILSECPQCVNCHYLQSLRILRNGQMPNVNQIHFLSLFLSGLMIPNTKQSPCQLQNTPYFPHCEIPAFPCKTRANYVTIYVTFTVNSRQPMTKNVTSTNIVPTCPILTNSYTLRTICCFYTTLHPGLNAVTYFPHYEIPRIASNNLNTNHSHYHSHSHYQF